LTLKSLVSPALDNLWAEVVRVAVVFRIWLIGADLVVNVEYLPYRWNIGDPLWLVQLEREYVRYGWL